MKFRKVLAIGLSFVFAGILLLNTMAFGAILYVKTTGNDANSGMSWVLAKRTVQAAINAASEGDEIWVAAGTYLENIQNRVINSGGVDIAVNVALYGGFAGTESSRDQRDWNLNITLLDGNNANVVVRIRGLADGNTRIDGFHITKGNGGGISIVGSGPVITNNVIKTNSGPGISISDYKITQPRAHSVITRNTIVDNRALDGGGILVWGSNNIVHLPSSSPTIAYNVIARNEAADNGGGIGSFGHSSPVIANNFILANFAKQTTEFGVGGGGIYATKNDTVGQPVRFGVSAPTIINNVISANGGYYGGGICVIDSPPPPDPGLYPPPKIINNTLVANHGAGIFWANSFPIISNNLVAFNTWGLEQSPLTPSYPVIRSNCVYGNVLQGLRSDYKGIDDRTGLNGNISADPKLANYRIGEFHIQPDSPCRNAGSMTDIDAGWTDIDGQARVIGNRVDIGADESDGTLWNVPTPIIYVKPGGNDAQDGLTWATAKRTVSAGISATALTGGEVWVAAGTYAERIRIPAFVYLYGGFAGNETDRNNRNISANPTILDGGGIPNVVQSIGAGYLVSALDGFTVQNGGSFTNGVYPFSSPRYGGAGGGIHISVGSPYILNNVIRQNSLGDPFDNANKSAVGGGIYGYLSHPVITGNTLTQNELLNTFDGEGGAIYFRDSMPMIASNSIIGNRAKFGPAILTTRSIPMIIDNLIENNTFYNTWPTPLYLGAVEGAITLRLGENFHIERNIIKGNVAAMGGGINVSGFTGKILNNLIINNAASDPTAGGGGIGGGIYALAPTNATDALYIINNTIVGNTATGWGGITEQGGGIAVSIPPPITTPPTPPAVRILIANNIIAFNSSGIFEHPTNPMVPPTLIKNDVFNTGANYINLSPGSTDISVDPLFVNRPGGNFHLTAASPCINAGSNAAIPITLTTDFEGDPRIINATVDIGADEFTAIVDTTPPTVTITVPTSNPAYSTNQPVISIGGTATDNVGITRVTWSNNRGGSGTCVGTTSWSASGIFLFPGQNVITVTAQDREPAGNNGTDTLTITYIPNKNQIVDFDGDGKTDVAVYRTNTGAWYIIPSSNPSTPYGFGWGGDPTDKPVPGDYDGDGKTDIAVYRTNSGAWYVYPSGGGSPYGFGWGGDPTDKPAPGDYDGDGKTDIAVYRTNGGAWYVYPSGGGSPYGFGWGGDLTDKPAPGDYDGDGKTDIAVYRTNGGAWYVYPSGGGSPYGFGWGGDLTDKPAPGDYDGDGKTDIAVYRGGTGAWYVYPSGGGSPYGFGWGGDLTDKPVQGDYDGDGKTDIAVYRAGTGAWYVYPSGGGSPYGVGWGGDPSDIPVTMNLSSME